MKYLLSLILLLCSCQNISDKSYGALQEMITGELSESSITNGLKEALEKGTQNACASLSENGGYSKNALYRITIPKDLTGLTDTLKKIGFKQHIALFEKKMNEAAEEAAKKATPIFIDAISQMNLSDVNGILMGKPTAATDFFQKKTSQKLSQTYEPIIKAKMQEIGLIDQFNTLLKKYNSVPFSKPIKFTLEKYITEQALNGLFDLLAETERDIRKNPAARTSQLLQKVFSKQDK
jgi:hypothetical protein